MAKSTEKKPRAPRAKAPVSIEKASEDALQKMKDLGLDEQLQRDIEWCLGSYRHDRNPDGLQHYTRQALVLFQQERDKKTKGVTAKFIADLEKALNQPQA